MYVPWIWLANSWDSAAVSELIIATDYKKAGVVWYIVSIHEQAWVLGYVGLRFRQNKAAYFEFSWWIVRIRLRGVPYQQAQAL